MIHIHKAEVMFSRPSLQGILCFILLVLQSSSSDKVQKVMAKLRGEARLPCSYKIPQGESMKDYKIYWQTRGGLKPLVAIAYINATESSYTDPTYKSRTKMNEENFTLSISPVKLSDECTYECVILKEELITKLPVALSVVADFSKPIIQAERHSNVCGSEWLTLTCSSHGGYPRPRMVGSINNETVEWNSTAACDNTTGLFQINGSLQLNVTGDILVHCSVEYQDLKVSANFSWLTEVCPLRSSYGNGIIIASVVPLVFLLAGVVLRALCYCHTWKCSTPSLPTSPFQPVAMTEMTPQQLSNGTPRAGS